MLANQFDLASIYKCRHLTDSNSYGVVQGLTELEASDLLDLAEEAGASQTVYAFNAKSELRQLKPQSHNQGSDDCLLSD